MRKLFGKPISCFLLTHILTSAFPLFGQSAGRELPRESSSTPSTPCYAFLRDGDLWTVCQGTRERIDLQGKALDFAVSTDGSQFVAVWEKAHQKNSTQAPDGEILMVSLTGAHLSRDCLPARRPAKSKNLGNDGRSSPMDHP